MSQEETFLELQLALERIEALLREGNEMSQSWIAEIRENDKQLQAERERDREENAANWEQFLQAVREHEIRLVVEKYEDMLREAAHTQVEAALQKRYEDISNEA